MKMAKASEADLSMAMTLDNYLDAIDKGHMPDALSEDPESIEYLDTDDSEQYARLLDGLQSLLRTGSIFRVVWGMAVVCDPANECIDPNSDTIDHHPMRQLLEQQRDELLAAIEEVDECKEILENLIGNIKQHGNYSKESTLVFLGQARSSLNPLLWTAESVKGGV